jgi:Restriction Enzyme Adenine Methylase Associated
MKSSGPRRKPKRRPRRRLLVGFLEDVSANILEKDRQIIKEMIRRRTGVYALYRRDTLYYVGLASNLMGRVRSHLKDRHKGLWDRFRIYLTRSDEHIRELETLILRIARPTGNRVSGKLSGATDLKFALNRAIARRDEAQRAVDLGGYVARRLRRSRTKGGHGSLVLAGLFERRTPLRAEWRDETFRATLRMDGFITFRKKSYSSPTAAARAVVGRTVNGWTFWNYRGANRKWERLARLRR